MRHPAKLSALRLINAPQLEALPASLLRARRNADARVLSTADWLLRCKSDGRFLATVSERETHALLQPFNTMDVDEWRMLPTVLARLGWKLSLPQSSAKKVHTLQPMLSRRSMPNKPLSLDAVREGLRKLDIDDGYGERHALQLIAEPDSLQFAGRDCYRRPLWLDHGTARAWRRMRDAALVDSVTLQAISGFRSHVYQLGIFARKLARGQSIREILRVNAAPGYSEHHAGRALDIGTPGEPAAEESFERTPAFAWLQRHAGEYRFTMSYPRNNTHHITYEPWHWCWHPAS